MSLDSLGSVLFGIGIACLGLATISGIGYGLYNWGSEDLELGKSAWLGFVLFMKMIGGGIASLTVGYGLMSWNK